METKKHTLAQKKVNGAVQTFQVAVNEIDKAVTLIEDSIKVDEGLLTSIENQIKALEIRHDETQANIITKKSEVKKHVSLALKLKDFTLGGQ